MKTTSSNYRWVILASLTAMQVGTSAAVFSFGPLAPFLQDDLSISRAQVGLLTSAVYLGAIVISFPAGWLADKVGVRRLMALGPLIQGVAFILFSRATSFHMAFALIALSGVGYGFMNPVVIKGLLGWFSTRDRATAVSIKQTGVTGGSALAAAVLPVLALSTLGWRGAVPFVGLLAIAVGIVCFVVYRNPPAEEKQAGQQKPARVSIRSLLTSRNMVLLGLMSAFLAIVHFSVSTYLVLFLKDSLSFSVVLAGSYLAATQMGATVGRVTWALVSDRLLGGRRKPIFYCITLLAAAITTLLALFSSIMPHLLLLALVVLLGFSALAWQGVFLTYVGESAGKEQAGTALGLGTSMGYVGIMAGPPLFGLVVDASGSYTMGLLMLSASALVACALILPVREAKAAPSAQPASPVAKADAPAVKEEP